MLYLIFLLCFQIDEMLSVDILICRQSMPDCRWCLGHSIAFCSEFRFQLFQTDISVLNNNHKTFRCYLLFLFLLQCIRVQEVDVQQIIFQQEQIGFAATIWMIEIYDFRPHCLLISHPNCRRGATYESDITPFYVCVYRAFRIKCT